MMWLPCYDLLFRRSCHVQRVLAIHVQHVQRSSRDSLLGQGHKSFLDILLVLRTGLHVKHVELSGKIMSLPGFTFEKYTDHNYKYNVIQLY